MVNNMSVVEFTDFLIKSLVKEPDLVKVECFDSDEETKIIEIIIPNDEMKNIIGHNGRNASSIRTVIQAFALARGMKKVKINIDSY